MKRFLPGLIVACAVSRLAAADFTVTNTNNSGPGSLYQAITDANNTFGADRILFNIPGSGVQKIDVSQNLLPTVSESLVIDGYSQPGAKPNSLTVGDNAVILIQVDGGAGSVTATGLVFNGATSDYMVRGLSMTGFGVHDFGEGVAISASGVHSAVVAGNFIGVLPDGETGRGNSIGIGHVTQLGGTDPASRNIISGNTVGFAGVARVTGTALYGAVVQGNYIGTNASGTKAIPNGVGIDPINQSPCISSTDPDLSNTIIGGTAAGAGNLISGNFYGITFGRFDLCSVHYTVALRPHGLRIKGNLIGVQSDGVSALPNTVGINIYPGHDNVIGGLEAGAGNVIAFNDSGVIIGGDPETVRNQILSNAIYANGIGIDLAPSGPTPNDDGDSDNGPNKYQNYPVIQSAEIANGSVTIKGTLNSSANAQFTLQYFAESLDLVRPAQTCLGTSTVTTDANGNAQFSAVFPLSDTNVAFNMTATSQDGNTSEFAQNAPRLRNVSTRARVLGGDHVTIAGFIRRSTDFAMVIRALGPSLPGLDSLRDPTLDVYASRGRLIATNDNWRQGNSAAYLQSVGLAPAHDSESAVRLVVDAAGNYTAVVRGVDGAIGITLIEVFASANELLNISTRGFVGTGDDVMIAGTILEQVTASTRLVARALGPSLAAAGITDPLADPMIELHDSQGAVIASNDDWHDEQPEALAAVGLAPSEDKEAAILVRLPSGAYTAIMRGKDGATGVGLIEIYNLH